MLYYKDDFVQIHHGNALEVLRELPSESVQCVITSPPYWGLRNYAGGSDIIWGDSHCEHEWGDILKITSRHESGETNPGKTGYIKDNNGMSKTAGQFCSQCGAWRGQLGLEPTPELYVEHLMVIFREVKRVLRKDGSFYLNIGDTYAGSGCGSHDYRDETATGILRKRQRERYQNKPVPQLNSDVPSKCMVCIPERVLFAMLEDHWILRNKIIWHKRNHMPGSQKDRFTQSWEYLYFFTKSRKYYFNLDAVRVPHTTASLERYQRGVNLGRPAEGKSGVVGPMQQYIRAPEWFQEIFPPNGDYKGKFDDLFGHGPNPQSFNLRVRDVKRGKKGTSAQSGELKASEQEVEDYEYPERTKYNKDTMKETKHGLGLNEKGHSGYFYKDGSPAVNPKGKNPGDLWSIATKPSSISVCPSCETVFPRLIKICPNCKIEGIVGHFAPYPEALCIGPIKASSRVGDIILDPFAGGGTSGVVAKRLGRQAIIIDCVRPYCVMAKYKLQRVEYQPEMEENV